jgi:DNA-binding LacI/PurR family transcriptional regulator
MMFRTARKTPSSRTLRGNHAPCPHVALLIETSLASGRDILRGIGRYMRENQPWAIFHEPRSLEESGPCWLKSWQGDGIIARVQNRQIADLVHHTHLPVVDVLGLVPGAGIPLVHVDNSKIARLAAEHLRERGFRHFGYYGLSDENWSAQRRNYFREWLGEFGRSLAIYEQPRHDRSQASWEDREDEFGPMDTATAQTRGRHGVQRPARFGFSGSLPAGAGDRSRHRGRRGCGQ